MKKTILLLLAAIGFFILPSSKVLAQATVIDSHFEDDLTYLGIECEPFACNGLGLTFEGIRTVDNHYVANKNVVTRTTHIAAHFTATDASGNTYIGKESTTRNVQDQLTGDKYSFMVTGSIRFVSQGSAPNFYLKLNSKYTVNADGTVTVDRYDTTTNCE